jgi:uncharacterized SAM-binding protein YcdF (DUF218 family)
LYVVVYGCNKAEIELDRIISAKKIAEEKRIKNIILSGTKEEIERMKKLLRGFNILEAVSSNTITNVTSVIEVCERDGIDFKELFHVSQNFHLRRIRIIWKKFGISLKTEGSKKVFNELLENEEKWVDALKNMLFYHAPQIAASHISNDMYEKYAKNERISQSREEIAITPRTMP